MWDSGDLLNEIDTNAIFGFVSVSNYFHRLILHQQLTFSVWSLELLLTRLIRSVTIDWKMLNHNSLELRETTKSGPNWLWAHHYKGHLP